MSNFDDALSEIDRGLLGLNTGIPHGYERLRHYIPDIQRATYYLVGAESSIGKTAYIDNTFIYTPYEYIKSNLNANNKKLKIFCYSFEISKNRKIIKGIARNLFLKYNLLLDVNYILSRGKNRIAKEHYDLVLSERKYFEELEDILVIYDVSENPTAINKTIRAYCESVGKIEVDPKTNRRVYKPNNPDEDVYVIIDHYGLTKSESGLNKKQLIDRLSGEYLVNLRNLYGISPIMISQFNRDISSTDRLNLSQLEPKPSDFKETSNTFEDCDICLALFSPFRHKVKDYYNYDILKLRDRFRGLSILKNRDGAANISIGLNFIGEVGYFRELPRADQMTLQDYIKYTQITN